MPHTLSLRLIALCAALSISVVGEMAMLTSSRPSPQEQLRLRSPPPTQMLPTQPENVPLALIPMSHM